MTNAVGVRRGSLAVAGSVVVALAISACDARPARDDSPPVPPDTAAPVGGADTSERPGFAERAPDSVLVRRGACPFECCVYGEWALKVAAPVLAAPEPHAASVFSLASNQRFRADSGFVRITQKALVAVHDTVDQRPYARLFLPGDTLLVLDYVGEGHFNVWDGERVMDVEGFWGAEQPKLVAELIGRYEREWWVHATLDTKQGWLLAEPTLGLIGADRCAGPAPWQR